MRGGVVGQGLRGVVGGVTAGVTGVVWAPVQGYSDSTGFMVAVDQTLLTTPLSIECLFLSRRCTRIGLSRHGIAVVE